MIKEYTKLDKTEKVVTGNGLMIIAGEARTTCCNVEPVRYTPQDKGYVYESWLVCSKCHYAISNNHGPLKKKCQYCTGNIIGNQGHQLYFYNFSN